MNLDPQTQAFIDKAEAVYRDQIQQMLETDHNGELIALEPDSGDDVLGTTFREVDVAALKRFGTKKTHIFKIGGGGAVKIGVGRNAGVS